MRYGIVVFPGTWSEADCHHAMGSVLGEEVHYIWHEDSQDLHRRFDCVVLPGGFSYGDYLRAGAIARFSPIMASVSEFAALGGLVIGICNGFQILCEAGLLPGALMRNQQLSYRCQWTHLRVEQTWSRFTQGLERGQVIHIPISHGEGSYYADGPTLQGLEEGGQVAFRYCTPQGEVTAQANPNGSVSNIAGVTSEAGNVLGMMPHPERAFEDILGGTDGTLIFKSLAREVTGR